MLVRLMGRQFSDLYFVNVLKTGPTMVSFQSFDSQLKHTLKGLAVNLASLPSNLGCISSAPVNLPISSLLSKPRTPSSSMVTLSSVHRTAWNTVDHTNEQLLYSIKQLTNPHVQFTWDCR